MHVVELWRYPVKSMQGESLTAAEVGPRGLVGDRRWAVVDEGTGLALTARREPDLLMASARLVDNGVEITLPDGSRVDDDATLSAWIGRPVRLVEANAQEHGRYEIALDFEHEDASDWFQWDGPDGVFHDSGKTQVSIMSTETIRQWNVRRFRPNVLVDTGGEDALVGSQIRLGTAVLEVVKPISRCVMTTRPQPGIERDLDVLRTINREREGDLGIASLVVQTGRVAVGDSLVVDETVSTR